MDTGQKRASCVCEVINIKLCIYGEIGIDILVDNNSKIISRWGGAGLYAALAAAKQKVDVEFLTVIGPEVNEYALNLWSSLGISFDLSQKSDNYCIPKYLVTGYKNYEKKVSRPMIDIQMGINYDPKLPEDCSAILIFPLDHSIPEGLCLEAYERNIPIFIDPKPNAKSIESAKRIMKYASMVLANEEEAMLLSCEKNLQQAERILKVSGPEYIVIKRGVKGCSIISEKNNLSVNIPAFSSNAVCTLGSGDVFGGVLSALFLKRNDIIYSSRMAACVAANFIEHYETESIIGTAAAEYDMKVRTINDIPIFNKKAIYLAGPFFCIQELEWVNNICCILENVGFRVFSPSRENGIISETSSNEQRKETFILDIELIEKSDIVVALLDQDDSGTYFEIGYAYKANKKIIGLKTSLNSSEGMNNMIVNGCNTICFSVDNLVNEVCKYAK